MNKQIEEIKRIIDERCEAKLGQVHANSKDGKVTKTVDTSLIAKDIYESIEKSKQAMAYRIVELEKLLDAKCDRCIERERKETARDIFEKILDFVRYETFRKGYELKKVESKIQELAKENGVEL